MLDFSSLLPADVVQPTGFLRTLLTMSPTAIAVLRPLYSEDGATIRDFAWVSLNPAGQRMLALPACPAESLLTLFPHAQAADGDFPLYLRAFATGELGENRTNYQTDGVDGYFRTVAQRYDNVLVVNFTDTNDQPRSAVEQALRASQAAEQAARAEAEVQRQRFHEVLLQLPAYVAVYHGPDHIYQFVNPPYQSMFPHRAFPGRPFSEVMPEANGLGVVALFDQVYQTGEPFHLPELEGWFDFQGTGEPEQVFLNLYLLPLRNAQGQVDGVLDYSHNITEQVRARQERETQRTELQNIFEQAPIALARLRGPDFVVEWANARMTQMWGRPLEQLVGRPHFEALPDLAGQGLEAVYAEVWHTGQPHYSHEALVGLAHAQPPYQGYFNITFQPTYDELGHVTGLLASAIDVTEQVRARQQVEQLNAELEERVEARTAETLTLQANALAAAQRHVREREEFYQVFEQAPVIVALLRGPNHFVHYCNPAFQGLFPGRTLTGQYYAAVMPEIVAAGLMPALDRVYTTGQPYEGTALPVVTVPPDGSAPEQRYYDFSYQPYREADRIVGISIFAYDVTEQTRARQQREQQQRQLYAAFEQAPVGIAIQTGPDLVYEYHNPSYQRMVPDRQLPGRRFFDVFPEMAGTSVETLLRHVYETGETQQEQDLLIPVARADGSAELEERYFTIVYQARRDEQGGINGVLAFVLEVTGQARARQQVQDLNAELMASNKDLHQSNTQLTRTNVDLDNFIYTASHDLKAPITNIEGLLLALEHELPEAARTDDVPLMLTMMQDAVDRFRRTIDHLTDLSRLQKEHNPASDAVALAPVVDAVRLDLTPLLAQTQGELTVSIPEGLTATFAEKNLRSVVYNLLSNAFKYRHPDRVPAVQLRSWLADEYAVLEVQDNGLGLDLAQGQDKLFAMFQRLHTHVEGTGVGLYMVKRILENAGGRIEATSQLGQGSTFRVYFQR